MHESRGLGLSAAGLALSAVTARPPAGARTLGDLAVHGLASAVAASLRQGAGRRRVWVALAGVR